MLSTPLGDGVSLRLLELSDAEEMARLVDENRAYLSRWMPWAIDDTIESTRAFIERSRRQLADDDGMQTAIVIEGRLAGSIGVQGINRREQSTEVGYWIAEPHQHRGAVTAAVRAYLDHSFGAWELHRVEIRCAVDNVRSRAVPERLGFTEEGVLREAERFPDHRNDLVVYAMLAPEWAAISAARR